MNANLNFYNFQLNDAKPTINSMPGGPVQINSFGHVSSMMQPFFSLNAAGQYLPWMPVGQPIPLSSLSSSVPPLIISPPSVLPPPSSLPSLKPPTPPCEDLVSDENSDNIDQANTSHHLTIPPKCEMPKETRIEDNDDKAKHGRKDCHDVRAEKSSPVKAIATPTNRARRGRKRGALSFSCRSLRSRTETFDPNASGKNERYLQAPR